MPQHRSPLQILALAAPPEQGGGDISAPFEVIRAGDFKMDGRDVKISEADLDAMVANFQRWQQMGAEVPVDYDHSFYEGGESRAAGWFTELARKGRSLFARVHWTEKAAELIRNREYRFFSPEWHPNWKAEGGEAEGPTMLAGALTNRPFLRGMTPVALSQEAGAAAWASTNLDELAAALRPRLQNGLTAAASTGGAWPARISFSGDETRSEVPDPETTPAPEQPPENEPSPEEAEAASAREGETVTMSRSEADDLRRRAGEATELRSSVEALSSRVDGLSSDLDHERFAADFGQALREGRVDAKDETRETWKGRYEKFGREDARALLFEMPADTIPVRERGSSDAEEMASEAPEGVDQEAHELDEVVKAHQREHEGLSYSQAYDAVMAQRRERAEA